MLKILLIKTSSMGDVVHTLPALTDAGNALADIQFDWVVEQPFAEMPGWHPLVKNTINLSLRRWRKQPWRALRSGEWRAFYKELRAQKYDRIIDAQGLIKSAFITRLAQGERCGLDWQSAWESPASLAYRYKYKVEPAQHAVVRMRQLFAQALGYAMPDTVADYGIDRTRFMQHDGVHSAEPYVVFLHGTTWATKHWPEAYWRQLAEMLTKADYAIKIPWGNAEEYARALRIAKDLPQVQVLPKLNLATVAQILAGARACVAVDTGLGHLAAALQVPTLSLYGATDASQTGTVGAFQQHLSADFPCAPCLRKTCHYKGAHNVEPPCFSTVNPARVLHDLQPLL